MKWYLILIATLILSGCSNSGNTIPCENDPNCLVYGLTLDVSGIDPHINRSSELGIILRQVYDTIVYRDPETNEFVAGLAKSWEISEDGLTYTFILREDVLFHDGEKFNAQAVAANIDRIFDPETNSQRARFMMGPFSRYEIVDDYTIRFYLTEPYTPFLDSLAQVYIAIASPKALQEYSLLRYQFHQVGTGPFKLVNYLPGDSIELERNTDYAWAPSFYQALTGDEIYRIVFRFFEDSATRSVALLNGDADVMGELLPADARILSSNSAIQLLPISIAGQPLQYYINTQLAPTNDLAIRQALLYATNRVAIVDAVFQNFSPMAWAPLSANMVYAHSGLVNQFAFNSTTAKGLLEGAGYQDTDNDGILDKDGEALSLTMIVPPWGQVPEVAQLIEDQWREIGIDLKLDPVPGFVALLEKVNAGNYHLVAFDNFGLDPSVLNSAFLSNGTDNMTGYQNEQLDQILIQATQERDIRTRRSQYNQIQATVMEQALIIPIRDYVNINATRSNISGLRFDPYGWFPLLYNVSKN